MTIPIRFPKILYSYLATEMLAPFFASFLIMNSVFFLVKLIPFLNVVLELEIGVADFFRFFLYLFPNMFLYSMPMAAMMGVIIGFTRLASDTEILAFKASGISLYQLLPPVVIISAAIAVITGYFSITLIPKAETAMKELMFQVAKEKVDKGIKEHQFTEALGDLVVYVDAINKTTGTWKDVWVSDMRGQDNPIITMAKFGTMSADINTMIVTITLQDGSLHRPADDKSQIISFDNYTIEIPLQPPTKIDGEDVTKLSKGAKTMRQLQEGADFYGRYSEEGREHLVQYHKRIVLPVGCFILSLLGFPLGLRAGPGKRAAGVPLGLGFFILYYIMFTMGKSLAEDSALPPFITMWSTNLIFLGIVVYFIRQAANERPMIPGKISNSLEKFVDNRILPLSNKVKVFFSRNKPPEEVSPKKSGIAPPILKRPEKILQPDSSFLTEGTIHGNVISHVYHIPGCEFYYCQNCTIEFKSIEIAQESGFEACRFCKNIVTE